MFAIPIFGAGAIRSGAPIWLRIAAFCGAGVSLSAIFFTIYPIIDVPSTLSFAVKIIAVTAIANATGIAIYLVGKKRQRT
jgi:glutamate:GABA antiporter